MQKLLESIINEISKNYTLEIQHNNIVIKHKHIPYTYANITIEKKLVYIDMIHISEDARGRGIGRELFNIIIKTGKRLNCKWLSGHITDKILFEMFIKDFGKENLKFYKSGLFRDKKITYEEGLKLLEVDGPIIYAAI